MYVKVLRWPDDPVAVSDQTPGQEWIEVYETKTALFKYAKGSVDLPDRTVMTANEDGVNQNFLAAVLDDVTLALINAKVFVMNEQGETIDSFII